MDTNEALLRAWHAGHFWGFENDLTFDEIPKLHVNHKLAQQAWKSWREADANFDTLPQAAHGPGRLIQDDQWGPATDLLTRLPRCAIPDHRPPQGVDGEPLFHQSTELRDCRRLYPQSRREFFLTRSSLACVLLN